MFECGSPVRECRKTQNSNGSSALNSRFAILPRQNRFSGGVFVYHAALGILHGILRVRYPDPITIFERVGSLYVA